MAGSRSNGFFKVIINESIVGTETNLKTRVAQIYDIKKFLKPGTNVIAISVTRDTYPGSAQLLVYGGFKEPGGKTELVISDEHWRVTPRTGIVQGTEEWSFSPGAGTDLAERAPRHDP